MTSDITPVEQPDGTYIYMKNCTLIGRNGSNYAVQDSMGNTKIFSLPIAYSDTFPAVTYQTEPCPLMFVSLPNGRLFVFFTNDETEDGGYGEFGEIKYWPYGEGIQPKTESWQSNAGYTPFYHHPDLNFSKLHMIEGYGFVESPTIERIYWSDNNEEPRVVNVADDVFTTYIDVASCVVGQKYMVLQGIVQDGTTEYAPGIGNIFECTGIVTNVSGTSPAPILIEYYPIEFLAWTPDANPFEIQFQEYVSGGQVYCGNKVYYGRLTTADGSYKTPFCSSSSPIPVITTQEAAFTSSVPYHDAVGAGTQTVPVISTKTVRLKLKGLDTKYDFVEIACIEYDQVLDIPTQISIVAREAITGTDMSVDHTGLLNLGDLTINDLTLFPASVRKVKTLTTDKNYNLIANIQEREEIFYQPTTATITHFTYWTPSLWRLTDCTNPSDIYIPPTPTLGANPGAGEIIPNSRYLVSDAPDASNRVSYNGVFYYTGDVFVGVTGTTTATFTGTAQARPCVTKNKYYNYGTADRNENAIEITGNEGMGFWDYKEPTLVNHCHGYWKGENYRLAIKFYDKKGKPFYPIHLGDYEIPKAYDLNGLIKEEAYTSGNIYSLNITGLRIGGIQLSQQVIDLISGFSIVRAVRNPKAIAQGIVQQVTTDGSGNYRPASYVPTSEDFLGQGPAPAGVADKKYVFICPDDLVQYPFADPIGNVGNRVMQEVTWVGPIKYQLAPDVIHRSEHADNYIFCKFLDQKAEDAYSGRQCDVTSWQTCLEAAAVSVDGGSFSNDLQIGTATTPVLCGGTSGSIDNFQGVGGKKVVFESSDTFNHYGTTNSYTSDAAAGLPEKILMNCVNTSGGTYPDPSSSTYIDIGHYQPIDAAFLATTVVTPGILYQVDGIEVFGGDCYTCMIDYGYGLYNEDYATPYGSYSYAWFFPCECNSNYNYRRGRLVSSTGMYYNGVTENQEIVYKSPGNATRLEYFSYNQAYSSQGTAVAFAGLPSNYLFNSYFDKRIRYAGPKLFGEIIDSFRTFLINDYKDMDAAGGSVNKIATKDARVLVWQNMYTGTVPVLERQLLSGLSGAATTLGTGGVVDRFDPIDTYHGSQHQWSVIETEYGFAWFDMRRKAFMVFDNGVGEMSQILGLKSFFDEIFVESPGSTFSISNGDTPFLNSFTYDPTSDRPLVGTGIIGVYDPKFKMTYMTFKFISKSYDSNTATYNYVNKDFTIMYYHPTKKFVGFSDWLPCIVHNHDQFVIAANNPKNLQQYYGPLMPSTVFAVGNIIGNSASEYVCTTGGTVASYATPPSGSLFTKLNSTNELWVNNQPSQLAQTTAPDYLFNKQFGRVVDNEITFVVNPKTQDAIYLASHEDVGSNVKYTDVYITNDTDTASDTSISSTDRNYRWILDRITASYPLGSTGRIIGTYIKVRFYKKNWTTNPTVLTGSFKLLQKVISKFSTKR